MKRFVPVFETTFPYFEAGQKAHELYVRRRFTRFTTRRQYQTFHSRIRRTFRGIVVVDPARIRPFIGPDLVKCSWCGLNFLPEFFTDVAGEYGGSVCHQCIGWQKHFGLPSPQAAPRHSASFAAAPDESTSLNSFYCGIDN